MKKALPYILSVGLFVYLIIVLTFASTKLGEVECKGIQVVVDDAGDNAFIDEEEVQKVIERGYGGIVARKITAVDKDSVEGVLAKHPVIKSAQVYYSLDGYFHVEITQRKPVLRIMSGEGYYVDEDGKIMPLSGKYTSRVIVATGNISRKFACNGLYPFVMKIRDDHFWDALIEQIIVTKGEEVMLIPKMGQFRIIVGGLTDVDRKMENLRLFLREGIALKGWNVYKEINLKFENQIVCVKR